MDTTPDVLIGISVCHEHRYHNVEMDHFQAGRKVVARATTHVTGTSVNVASALRLNGFSPFLIGAVSVQPDDPSNYVIESGLRALRIEHTLVPAREVNSQATIILPANLLLSSKPPIVTVPSALIEQATANMHPQYKIATGVMNDPLEVKLVTGVLGSANGGIRILNPREQLVRDRDLFDQATSSADWLFMNRYEAAAYLDVPPDAITANQVKQLLVNGVKMVVVTKDGDGVLAVSSDGLEVQAESHVHGKFLDETGAGDCFLAFFLTALRRGFSHETSIAAATIAAGIKVCLLGTMNIPTWEEVEARL